MQQQFYIDLEKGHIAEKIVKECFSKLTDSYEFEDVSGEKHFFYRGDILAREKATGEEIFIEVKNDSRIADTGNILCEEEVYFKQGDYTISGNMSNDTDIFAIVSQQEKKIYVLDFKILKANYRKGQFKVIEHPTQTTYCYLVEVCLAKKFGALIAIVEY